MSQTRNTIQKDIIKQIALSTCDHPTADDIYMRAKKQLPNISVGTTYRILTDLVEKGQLRLIGIPGQASRFDKTIAFHMHFLCSRCNKVEDIMMESLDKFVDILPNTQHSVMDADVVLKGICKDCKD